MTELRDGMLVDWDVEILTDDGLILRADVYRPTVPGRYPVLMTYGPYAKGLPFQDGYKAQWDKLVADHPDVAAGSTLKYANWETVDPEKWVPDGYVCIRVDSRGAGRSEGFIDPFSSRETQDYYQCIEWAAQQPWSNGKVGLLGVSYYAMNQWQVAALRPPHLAAICPFEGASDFYRDGCRHGGILSTFWINWYPKQVMSVQHGLGSRGRVNPNNGRPISGPAELSDAELESRRVDIRAQQLEAQLITDSYFTSRLAALENIEVPVLSCGNWGGQGLHLRGNVQGFVRAGSSDKWLEMHGLEHWTEFYTDYGVSLQKRFFGHYLKGEDNGWPQEPKVRLQVRTIDGFKERFETSWPLPKTVWTSKFLSVNQGRLLAVAPATEGQQAFDATSEGINFKLQPFTEATEITGPVMAKLFVSSSTDDADLFLTVRAFDPTGKEHLIVGAVEPNAPVAQGWLRASHRKLDQLKSKPYLPIHAHDEVQLLVPHEVYELDIEIWPTSFVFPAGYSLVLTVAGRDFDHGLPEPMPKLYGRSQRGSSVFMHDDSVDRHESRFAGTTTIHTGGAFKSYLLLPIIPNA